jgi:hypothetical protein
MLIQQFVYGPTFCIVSLTLPLCRVPVCAAALSHVAQRLPDAAFLAAARQLQEELQACWVHGEQRVR